MPNTLDFDRLPDNPRFALRVATILLQINSPNAKQQIDSLVQGAVGLVPNSTFAPAGNAYPAWWYGEAGGLRMLFAGGATTANHGARWFTGMLQQRLDAPTNPTNAFYDDWVSVIQAQINTGPFTRSGSWILGGYSLGGGLVEYANPPFDAVNGREATRICTFGAPKSVNTDQARVLTNAEVGRYMISADPVPLIPPPFDELPPLYILAGPVSGVRLSHFVHPHGGLSLASDGKIYDAVLPPNANVSGVAAIAQWIVAQDQSAATPHSISTYQQWLFNWVAAHPETTHIMARGAPTERANPTTVAANNRAEQEAARLIFRQAEEQDVPLITVPRPARFRAERFGRMWAVAWQGQFVAVCPRKRRALAIARDANAFLDGLLASGFVSGDQLPTLVQDWVTSATDPAQGFVPTLKTVWPTP